MVYSYMSVYKRQNNKDIHTKIQYKRNRQGCFNVVIAMYSLYKLT